jgi:dephospho-CoA kinase
MERDHLTTDEAAARMSIQPPEEFYTDYADFVIDGTLEIPSLSRKVRTILKSIEVGYDV